MTSTGTPTYSRPGARPRVGSAVLRVPLVGRLALAAAPALLVAMATRALRAQTTAALPSTRAVRVQIETDRASYRAGDSIVVRLTLSNTGALPVQVRQAPPWWAVRLVVTGADGGVIAPVDDPDERYFRTGRPYTPAPQQLNVLQYDLTPALSTR